jgi:hypothetical protein
MNKSADDERGARSSRQPAPTPTGGPSARPPGGRPAMRIYKPGQGAYVRWGSAVAAAVFVLGFTKFVYEQLARVQNEWVQFLIPVALLAVLGYAAFRLLG